jgi:hypothetical protein
VSGSITIRKFHHFVGNDRDTVGVAVRVLFAWRAVEGPPTFVWEDAGETRQKIASSCAAEKYSGMMAARTPRI